MAEIRNGVLVKALDDIAENKLSFRKAEAKRSIPNKSIRYDYKTGKVEVGG